MYNSMLIVLPEQRTGRCVLRFFLQQGNAKVQNGDPAALCIANRGKGAAAEVLLIADAELGVIDHIAVSYLHASGIIG